MRNVLLILLAATLCAGCARTNNDIEQAVRRQLEVYPLSTMQDIYKSFYQDRFGPGHMITDTLAVREYLLYEVSVADADTVPNPYYENVGDCGRYVRVYLRCVNEGMLTAEQLSDAFLRSARPQEQTGQSWADEWKNIERIASRTGVTCPAELSELLREAAETERAVHHSEAYRNAYHPHYRIIERSIFARELQALIDQRSAE